LWDWGLNPWSTTLEVRILTIIQMYHLKPNMRQVQPEMLLKNSNLPVYKISSLKITPPKTPNSGQFSYPQY
jgi:hypothetical protein